MSRYFQDFSALKEIMALAKNVGCDSLYQFAAAAIASWFRTRTIVDVKQDLKLPKNHTMQLSDNELSRSH